MELGIVFNKSPMKMTLDQLAAWQLNHSQRFKVAKDLGCEALEGFDEHDCCIVHRNLHAELLLMEEAARNSVEIFSSISLVQESGVFPLTPAWWKVMGRPDIAKIVSNPLSSKVYFLGDRF